MLRVVDGQPAAEIAGLHAVEGLGSVAGIAAREPGGAVLPDEERLGQLLHPHAGFEPPQPQLVVLREVALSVGPEALGDAAAEHHRRVSEGRLHEAREGDGLVGEQLVRPVHVARVARPPERVASEPDATGDEAHLGMERRDGAAARRAARAGRGRRRPAGRSAGPRAAASPRFSACDHAAMGAGQQAHPRIAPGRSAGGSPATRPSSRRRPPPAPSRSRSGRGRSPRRRAGSPPRRERASPRRSRGMSPEPPRVG